MDIESQAITLALKVFDVLDNIQTRKILTEVVDEQKFLELKNKEMKEDIKEIKNKIRRNIDDEKEPKFEVVDYGYTRAGKYYVFKILEEHIIIGIGSFINNFSQVEILEKDFSELSITLMKEYPIIFNKVNYLIVDIGFNYEINKENNKSLEIKINFSDFKDFEEFEINDIAKNSFIAIGQ